MSPGPSLIQVGTDAVAAFGGKPALVVGRSREADLPVLDPACSRRQFVVRREPGRFVLEPLSDNSPTFCNGARVTGPVPLPEAAVIHAGASTFRLLTAEGPAAGRETVRGALPVADAVIDLSPVRPTDADAILGREPGPGGHRLPHPLVSRRHALVRAVPGGLAVRDLGSANGTFVNCKRLVPGVRLGVRLTPGDRVQIGPFALTCTGDALIPAGAGAPAAQGVYRLTAHQLAVVAGGARRLDGVTLGFRAGEFVAVVGPSGCGKSTLLKALAGDAPPADGRVLFDGCDLYLAPAGAARRVAVVPQREVLPTALPVGVALRFTAALRLPPDTAPADLDRAVDAALAVVGLADRRHARIADLSGGQVKRAGLANELLADPGLVLLDEVTSGLDEQADREMMGLFRQLANAGKTVLAVTHTLAHVAEYCHRVVVLAPGGRVAFVGRPADALAHFQIDRLGDVYDRLADHSSEEWATAFAGKAPRVPSPPPPPPGATLRDPADTPAAVRHQTPVLAQRTARVLLADRPALAVTLGQAGLVAGLLVWVFGDVRVTADPAATAATARSVLFVLAVTAFWLGCNTAAKEIVREWPLFRKERQANLSPAAYLLAKWGVLSAVTLAQVFVLLAVVTAGCHLPGSDGTRFAVLAAVGVAGVAAGLLASAVAPTEAVAVALVPVVVIPQLVLSDVFRPLAGSAKGFADLIATAHSGFGGLLTSLPPDLAAVAARPGETAVRCVAWILVQAVALAAVAWKVLEHRGRPLPPAVRRLIGGTP